MQPLTISFWSGRFPSPRCWCASRMASIDSSLAESMKAQVFTTSTSASSAMRRDFHAALQHAPEHDLGIDQVLGAAEADHPDLR